VARCDDVEGWGEKYPKWALPCLWIMPYSETPKFGVFLVVSVITN